MSRVVRFEIHAEEPERALKFYSDVFGWKTQKWDGPEDYWLITTGDDGEPGINGGLMKRRGPAPSDGAAVNAFPCTMAVEDLDGYIEKVNCSGGAVTVPKTPVPGVGYLAYCRDTEGNIFGVIHMDASAQAG